LLSFVPAEEIDAVRFSIGSEEYVLLTFPAPVEPAHVPDGPKLSPAEHAVASLALRGRSNNEIGRLRGTSARTIANQLSAIYRKLGVSSRRELRASPRTGAWKVR
jgi:DNA-binding CsgD family transcriptional regulator